MILKNKTEKKVRKEERKLENDPLLKKARKDGKLINITTYVKNLIGEGHFILVQVKEGSDGAYTECENDGIDFLNHFL